MLTKAQKLANRKLTNEWQSLQELGVQRDTLNALVYKGFAIKDDDKYRRAS